MDQKLSTSMRFNCICGEKITIPSVGPEGGYHLLVHSVVECPRCKEMFETRSEFSVRAVLDKK